ncbi:MAG: FecR domain-containing protein [Parabacteroides sp.]|nr:FecR domain-containing protein [Parabacteroides sp.]
MHELIILYFSGEITADEKRRLFSMMETDSDLRKQFGDAQNLHALTSLLPEKEDRAFATGKLLEFKQARRKEKHTISYKHIIGYAAAVCVAVLSTWMIMSRDTEVLPEAAPLIAYAEFATPSGQRAKVKLPDGTTVWLNARSVLRYPSQFTGGVRKVELNGEAFFEVSRDEKKPFVVSTEKLDIKVLGTEFNVFAYKGRNEFHTSLVEGSVKIYDSRDEAHALFIKPNERVDLVGDKLRKSSFDSMDFLLWREGIYAFDDVTFNEIIKKLELYYDVNIVVKNTKLDTYKFSGKFRQRDGVESVLRTLQKVKRFSFVKDEELNRITIR